MLSCSFRGLLATLTLLGVSATSRAIAAQQICPRGTLPAYAHNDYLNSRPLEEALERGFSGVEVDLFLVEGELRLGHDRGQAKRGATLEALYLAPLRAFVDRCGRLTTDDRPFLVAIELKESSRVAYDSLVELLSRYQSIFAPTRSAQGMGSALEIVLVGWHPPEHLLGQGADSLMRVQYRLTTSSPFAIRDPEGRVRMVTVDYGKTIGRSSAANRRAWIAALRRVKDVAPGRLLRVHNVPIDATLYTTLLDAGVDLIGTKELARTQLMLAPFGPR